MLALVLIFCGVLVGVENHSFVNGSVVFYLVFYYIRVSSAQKISYFVSASTLLRPFVRLSVFFSVLTKAFKRKHIKRPFWFQYDGLYNNISRIMVIKNLYALYKILNNWAVAILYALYFKFDTVVTFRFFKLVNSYCINYVTTLLYGNNLRLYYLILDFYKTLFKAFLWKTG